MIYTTKNMREFRSNPEIEKSARLLVTKANVLEANEVYAQLQSEFLKLRAAEELNRRDGEDHAAKEIYNQFYCDKILNSTNPVIIANNHM